MSSVVANPGRPLPVPQDWDRGYWEAAAQHRLVVQRCASCARVRSFPRLGCPDCGSLDFGWQEVSGEGTIYSWTRLRRMFHPDFAELPLVTCVVELIDEPAVHLVANLVDVDHDSDPVIGAAVSVMFEAFGDAVLPQFRLA